MTVSIFMGQDAAFGMRWDEPKGDGKSSVSYSGAKGWYDTPGAPKGTVAASVLAILMAEPVLQSGAQVLFFHDDDHSVFGRIVLTGSMIAPSSERIFTTLEDVMDSIREASEDNNLDLVLIPEDLTFDHEKVVKYRRELTHVSPREIRKARLSSGAASTVAVPAAIGLVAALALGGAGYFVLSLQRQPEPEYTTITELFQPDHAAILEGCGAALRLPWPSTPEWNLVEEGCVVDPGVAQISFSRPDTSDAYAYRIFRLSSQNWDPYLSQLSFLRLAERFQGQVIAGDQQMIMHFPVTSNRIELASTYVADGNPLPQVRQSFVGALRISSDGGQDGVRATTQLELQEVIRRLAPLRVMPAHLSRSIEREEVEMQILSERVDRTTRRVPIAGGQS